MDPDIQILEIFFPLESFYVINIYNEKSLSLADNGTHFNLCTA